MSVLGKGSHEMTAVHLLKAYCLPTLTYGCENSVLCESENRKIGVIWNNCFRHIFSCCWRKSVKPLRYFCRSLPLSFVIDQGKLLLWKKLYTSDNITLSTVAQMTLNLFNATVPL